MTLGNSSGIVFTWLANFSATAGLITWFGIGVIYLRFYEGLKAQDIDRKTFPFAPRMQPFAGWWCVCGSGLILIVGVFLFLRVTTELADAHPGPAPSTPCTDFLQFSGWEVFLKGNWSTATFVTNYFPIVFFPVIYVVAKRVMGVSTVSADDMDFVTDVAEFDAMTCVQLCCPREKRRVRPRC